MENTDTQKTCEPPSSGSPSSGLFAVGSRCAIVFGSCEAKSIVIVAKTGDRNLIRMRGGVELIQTDAELIARKAVQLPPQSKPWWRIFLPANADMRRDDGKGIPL